MIRIQSILAATDFSPDARYAGERAAMLGVELAMQRGVLLHVLEQSWIDNLKKFMGSSPKIERGIINNTSHSLVESIAKVPKTSVFSLEPQVRTGNVLDTIVETASDFDLLVLGAHGRHPVRAMALGTTSQRILGKMRQPVLVVRRKPEKPYQRVLVAVDFSPNSHKALAYSSVIAPQALIYLVHVFEPLFEMRMISVGVSDKTIEEYRIKAHSEAELEMTRFIKEVGMDPRKLVRHVEYGRPPGKLLEMAEKWDPDLIIVGKHGRSRVEELLLGSITVHMISLSQCDVLVVQ